MDCPEWIERIQRLGENRLSDLAQENEDIARPVAVTTSPFRKPAAQSCLSSYIQYLRG
jgi:hypothetical protein